MSKILTLPVTALLFMSMANAQSMDYGAMEQLFGEPGTTSATGSPQRAADVPANIIIVTADEIRRSGARDIPSILRHLTGVDVLQWANDNFDVSARGYNQAYSARTLVLVDGRQVYADSFGFTPWSAIPVELGAIRQIEIIKGPNAALFGFNAVAGVINIVTNSPRYDDVTTASLRYGSQNMAEASGVARLHWGTDVFFRLSGGYRSDKPFGTSNPLPVDGSPRRNNDRAALDANLVVVMPSDVELSFDVSHSDVRQNEVSAGYKLQTSEYLTNSVSARLSADTELGLVRVSAYNNWFDWTRSVGQGTVAPQLKNTVAVIQGEDLFNLTADHTIRLAAEYRHNEVEARDRDYGWVASDVSSASAMWNWQIMPTLSWTGALRFDSVAYGSRIAKSVSNQTGTAGPTWHLDEWSFNVGLVWNATPEDTFRLLAARGVQLPNLVQVWDTAMGQAGSGNRALQLNPSTVTNFEVLWNRRFIDIDARLQIAAFHQNTYDVISTGSGTIDTPNVPGLAPANVGSSRADGVEIGILGRFDEEWHWSASYRFEVINDQYLRAGSRTDLVNYEDTTPQHVAKAGLGWSSGDWEADIFLQYQSKSAGLRRFGAARLLVPVGAYETVDARVAYRLTDYLTMALSGQNLLESPQKQTSGPAVQRQFFLTLTAGI